MKQYSGIGRRDDRDLFQHPLDGWALANDAFEVMLGTNLAFEIELLGCQFAHWGKASFCNSFEVGESNGRAHSLLPNLYACSALQALIRTKVTSTETFSLRSSLPCCPEESVPDVARNGTAPDWDNLGRWLGRGFRNLRDA